MSHNGPSADFDLGEEKIVGVRRLLILGTGNLGLGRKV